MATFPDITPTYGLQKNSAPNVRIAQFGSGYSQRSTFGINQNPKVYSFTFQVSETDADTIEDFWMHAVERKALTSVRQKRLARRSTSAATGTSRFHTKTVPQFKQRLSRCLKHDDIKTTFHP